MNFTASNTYNDIISSENILEAWREFLCGKRKRRDVQYFALNLMDNIFNLATSLRTQSYQHDSYHNFRINDPKPRNINKATVKDRLVHHALYRKLYPYFDSKFIFDSYSCRCGKGTVRALKRMHTFAGKISQNNTRTVWILKCDIKKFFASVNHDVLIKILAKYISDERIIWLLKKVIYSYAPGLPLGNLTSQLLVNVYMHEFDCYIKRQLNVKYYIRYCDDFVLLNRNINLLLRMLPLLKKFLQEYLNLQLHPDKISLITYASGVDFLGWVNFPTHRVLRTSTKRRIFRRLDLFSKTDILRNYHGLLIHGNTVKLCKTLLNT